MSTKRIREALTLARARKGFGDTEEEMIADNAALEDLAKIEKAAKALHAGATGGGWEQPGVHEAFDVIASIAKDAP